MDSTPALTAFYHVNAIEDWKCLNIVEYYRSKVEQKDLKQVLDRIKKDLGLPGLILMQKEEEKLKRFWTIGKYVH